MRSASRKPRVVTSTVLSPCRSSSALVATVVPILTDSTSAGLMTSPTPRPNMRRIPSTAASRYCAGFSDSNFKVRNPPSGARPTTSVKVPPLSTQNCQRSAPNALVPGPNSQAFPTRIRDPAAVDGKADAVDEATALVQQKRDRGGDVVGTSEARHG